MRNSANYLDNGANAYLSSAELAAVADTYRYLNFDQIQSHTNKADTIIPVALVQDTSSDVSS